MEELLKKIEEEFAAFKKDATAQVEKGNKATGGRSRKSSLAIGKLMKEWREKSVKVGE